MPNDTAELESPEEVREEAHEKSAPTAQVVYEAIREEGRHEMERKNSSLAWSGLAAGLSMGFSFVLMAALHHHLPDTPWRPLIATFAYSLGVFVGVPGGEHHFTQKNL